MAIKVPGRTGAVRATRPEPRRDRAPRQNPITQFVRDSRIELRKVVWPTREETIRLTLVVVAVSAGTGLILGGFDFVLSQLFSLVAH